MGCNSSNSADDTQNNKPENKKDENKNKETIEQEEDKKQHTQQDNKEEKNKDKKINDKSNIKEKIKKDEKSKEILKLNGKKKEREIQRIDTDENKDALSNVLTEGLVSNDGRKFPTKKQQFNGITLMKGIEEICPEDLNEDEIYQLVEDALGDDITDEKDKRSPTTITKEQAKAVAKILHNKINKKKDEEDDKSGEIDIRKYPELKGVNIKIGVVDLTKEVIKNQIYNGQKVDDYQIDLTYNNLTENNKKFTALSIQILP